MQPRCRQLLIFALFQQIDGLLFFDLYDRNDVKAYGAVATSYDHFYHGKSPFKTSLQPDFAVYEGLRAQRPVNLDDVKKRLK